MDATKLKKDTETLAVNTAVSSLNTDIDFWQWERIALEAKLKEVTDRITEEIEEAQIKFDSYRKIRDEVFKLKGEWYGCEKTSKRND